LKQASEGVCVLAFGGNALLPDPFHPEQQEARAAELAGAVRLLLERSAGIVLVHGNGPQVGMILLRVEATRRDLPPDPLDVLVAETQGSIGYLLSRALRNALRAQGSPVRVTSMLTQVIVDPRDPAFASPSKPIGPHYSDDEALDLRERRGWHMVATPGKGWRRVVPSPRPLGIVELAAIGEAARAGHVVIAGGGGGIPVHERDDGGLDGVEAVIDKDRTSALLAVSLYAECYVILTDAPHVSRAFGTPDEERIERLTSAEARGMLAEGAFPRGSMAPKIEAALSYAEASGREALITSAPCLADALAGRAGTRVVPA